MSPQPDAPRSRGETRGPAAVLFDMDGLLVDTEPLWFLAEQQVVGGLGGSWTRQNQDDLLGSNLEFAAGYMIRHTGSRQSVDEVALRLKDAMTAQLRIGGIRFRPGVAELIDELRAASVRTALVTSSVRDHLDLVLAALPGHSFAVLVSGDDVTHKKPHPEPYLRAAQLLRVRPGECVVLEDSPAGVAAAEAAGFPVIAVPSVVAIDPAPGRHVVGSLYDVDLTVLDRLVTRS
jgi:HAD superfamily hydrolase (TIGR01509 family)